MTKLPLCQYHITKTRDRRLHVQVALTSGKICPIAIGKEALSNTDPTRRYAREKANVTGIEHKLPNSEPSHYTSWAIHAAMLLER
jgi:hypothetical protein